MTDPVIEFENVSKVYTLCHHIAGGIKTFLFHLPDAIRQLRSNRFVALEDISFRVAPAEVLGIIGPNGAGKSTALGLIVGVLRPSRGQVTVRRRVSPLLELGAGFHPDLTGRENVMLNGVLLGLTRRHVRKRLDEIIDFSELGPFIEEPVRTYSSGMLAKLGFSVVAHLDPEILLIDEILAVGDLRFQEKCLERIRRFHGDGVTIVLVSHAVAQVRSICDRALWLESGRLRMDGPAAEVCQAYVAAMS